jgi:hypothetical protein
LYSCDDTSFSTETQNISNQGSKEDFLLVYMGQVPNLNLNQPCSDPTFFLSQSKLERLSLIRCHKVEHQKVLCIEIQEKALV